MTTSQEPAKHSAQMLALTAKREVFAQRMAAGESQAEAYRQAYPTSRKWKLETLYNKASALMRVGEVVARVAELRAEIVDRLVINEQYVIDGLVENHRRAMEGTVHDFGMALNDEGDAVLVARYRYDGSVANKALELLGRHLGMFPTKVEHGGPDGGPIPVALMAAVAQLSDEELAALLRQLATGSD